MTRKEAIQILSARDRYGVPCGYTSGYQEALDMAIEALQTEVVRCKDCKHFEYDHPYIIQGIPVLGHEVCNAWGDGCKTDENGYCFMAERKTEPQEKGG